MGETVPQLIAELREHIVRLTGKPIDPDVDFLTTQIEVCSGVQALPISGMDLYGLSATESRIFGALATNPQRTLSRDALMTAAYFDRPDQEPEPKIMDVFILHIRRKLFRADADCWIKSVHSVGFQFVKAPARKERPAWMKA